VTVIDRHLADEPHRRLFILATESVSLDDAGLPGYLAAEGVDPAGDRILFLACQGLLGDGRYPIMPAIDVAHEQLGALDWRLRDRIGLAAFRCGRRTRAGAQCRVIVSQPGDACGWHR
jgi:hypothetical protein